MHLNLIYRDVVRKLNTLSRMVSSLDSSLGRRKGLSDELALSWLCHLSAVEQLTWNVKKSATIVCISI